MTRHDQHQDTDADSDGRDEVDESNVPAVSTERIDDPCVADSHPSAGRGLSWTEVFEVASEFGQPTSGPYGISMGALRIECGSGIAGRGDIWAIRFPGNPQLKAITGINSKSALRGSLRRAWFTAISLSGRESLTLKERADLLAAEIVQLQANSPTGAGHDVHQFNSMLCNMRACIRHCRATPVNVHEWGVRNRSATELRVMAWRRGGVVAYDAETKRLYRRTKATP